MHLIFAEASESGSYGWLILMIVFIVGGRKICSVLSGNKMARDATKKGGLWILGQLFKK